MLLSIYLYQGADLASCGVPSRTELSRHSGGARVALDDACKHFDWRE